MHRVNRVNYATSEDAAARRNPLPELSGIADRRRADDELVTAIIPDAAMAVLILRRMPMEWRDVVIALVTTPRNGRSGERQ